MLFLNQILVAPDSQKRFRVLALDQTEQQAWLFELDEPKALPRLYDLVDIEQAITENKLIQAEAPGLLSRRQPSEKALRRRDKAYAAIAPLVQTPQILDAEQRGQLVCERARELSCSEQTLYKYLRMWWRGGQSRNALLPSFHRIGNRQCQTGNRGRPPIYGQHSIYQLNEQDSHNMRKVIEEKYLKNKNCSVQHAHIMLLEQYYSCLDQEGCLRIKSEGEFPSITQFRYFLKKHYSKEQQIRSRKGDAAFELEHRPKLGSLRAAIYTIGQVYEIDATIADTYLVHPKNRTKIIGKPTIYMIRDRKSNLVVGFYVGLESPCWAAAMQAIKSISEDKQALCARFGVAYNPADWPAHQVFPQEFCADRGSEMLSGHSTQLADGLEINVTNLPSRRADWKPYVECGFKQTLRPIASDIPGYTPPEDFGKRQQRDPAQDAALTLDEFTKLILERIILANRKPQVNNPMLPKHVLDGVQPTPINIWNIEIRERAGLLTRYSEEQVLFALLPKTQASVSREGIRIGDCFYSAEDALKKGWFVRAGDGRFSVTASYDSRLVDSVFIHDETHPDGYFVAQLLEKCGKYRGLSFAEVAAIEHQQKRLQHEGRQIARQLEVDLRGNTQPMIQAAIADTKAATKGKSRTSRKKDIVDDRADARRSQRQLEARLSPETPNTPKAEVVEFPRAAASNNLPKSISTTLQDIIDGN